MHESNKNIVRLGGSRDQRTSLCSTLDYCVYFIEIYNGLIYLQGPISVGLLSLIVCYENQYSSGYYTLCNIFQLSNVKIILKQLA